MENTAKSPLEKIFKADPSQLIFPKFVPLWVPITKPEEVITYQIDNSSGYFLRKLLFKAPNLYNDQTRPKWTAGAAYNTGDIVLPSAAWLAANPGNIIALVMTAAPGNAGGAEPAWPRDIGTVTADGPLTWQSINAFSTHCPQLKLEILDIAADCQRQSGPMYADILATPGTDSFYLLDNPSPVDQDRNGKAWNVPKQPTTAQELRWRYNYGDTIKITVSGQQETTLSSGAKVYLPNYCELFLIGYYCPLNRLE